MAMADTSKDTPEEAGPSMTGWVNLTTQLGATLLRPLTSTEARAASAAIAPIVPANQDNWQGVEDHEKVALQQALGSAESARHEGTGPRTHLPRGLHIPSA